MNLSQFKSHHNILEVAQQLGIQIGRNDKALCPFHTDKSPSLQFSRKRQIATCFSSACTAGTMDVLDLVQKSKNCTLPEAVSWLKEQSGEVISNGAKQENPITISQKERIEELTKLHNIFQRSIINSSPAKKYMESRSLDHRYQHCGYNNGKWHLDMNADQIEIFVALGLLFPSGQGYRVFGSESLAFALHNQDDQIVSFYFRAIKPTAKHAHLYLKNRQGLYPHYPSAVTKRIILTESIIDAATLIELQKRGKLKTDASIIANYGTEGEKEQMVAIMSYDQLEEALICFDGDEAGKKGSQEIAQKIKSQKPKLTVKIATLPQQSDINQLIQNDKTDELINSLTTAKDFFLSREGVLTGYSGDMFVADKTHLGATTQSPREHPREHPEHPPVKEKSVGAESLDTSNPVSMTYSGKSTVITIKGGLGRNGFDVLRLTLEIQQRTNNKKNTQNTPGTLNTLKSRQRVDLYDDKQVEKAAAYAAPKLQLSAEAITTDISKMTDAIDTYRQKQLEAKQKKHSEKALTDADKNRALKLLKDPDLITKLNTLIGKSGIVGEDKNRLLLFIVALSHKFKETLHAIVQASSGSGKTHLIHAIVDLMPEYKVKCFTRVSDKSFYNYGEFDLVNTLIVIEDYDGMNEDAEYAFRELQSNNGLNSAVSAKMDGSEKIRAEERKVRGPIATIVATTKGFIYEDNLNRVFQIAIDESEEQTDRILKRRADISAGILDEEEEQKVKMELQHLVQLIAPVKVLNPYAHQIGLPTYVRDRRRLSGLFESCMTHITRLHQYQRQRDKKGRCITTIEDVAQAIAITFDAIVLKVDELDGSLRNFFEQLKEQVKSKDQIFNQREIRQALRISKSRMHRYIQDLVELEYIRIESGHINRGYLYKVSYWDDIEALRARIKRDMYDQIDRLKKADK